ncbi:hypothetical protein NCS57_00670500 [Fusarium keratoplasticum]|uniref:Uncharacterized protein n=1 Tax=Fusarium keratoplasticum TaxID=1328300 RepID=A0ACC0QVV3_9HYPO|nr:hypothetical protein NCS57_00670500 [Fusarium keratoplasticum]KAI8668588.1 hypothetical protein NCS57_00670500 [Fusarium keratoplasticum]
MLRITDRVNGCFSQNWSGAECIWLHWIIPAVRRRKKKKTNRGLLLNQTRFCARSNHAAGSSRTQPEGTSCGIARRMSIVLRCVPSVTNIL